MTLIRSYVRQHVKKFIDEHSPIFDKVYSNIICENKQSYKELLIYIDRILDYSLLNDNNKYRPHFFHIHFESNLDQKIRNLIAQFIVVWCFYREANYGQNNQSKRKLVEQKLSSLKKEENRLFICPQDAKSTSKEYKSWKKECSYNKRLTSHYQKLLDLGVKNHCTLINCLKKHEKKLKPIFQYNPYAVDAKEIKDSPSYCILNTNKDIDELDSVPHLLESVKTIILFDCNRSNNKEIMNTFSYSKLSQLNEEEENIDFQNLFIMTFGKKAPDYFGLLKSKEGIQKNFYPVKSTDYSLNYIILNEEINPSKNLHIQQDQVEFIGDSISIFWQELETAINSIPQLYDLCSIRLRNLYSICYSVDIKEHILSNLFPRTFDSRYLSSQINADIEELIEEDELNSVYNALSNFLDYVIELRINDRVKELITNDTVILVDSYLLSDSHLSDLISSSLSLSKQNTLISWEGLELNQAKSVLVLSYRDQGNPRFSFNPNVFETPENEVLQLKSILIKVLFEDIYISARHRLRCLYYKLLNHPLRTNYFDWKKLNDEIAINKPISNSMFKINYELEKNYEQSNNRITYTINPNTLLQKNLFGSDKIVIRSGRASEQLVIRISDFYDQYKDDLSDVKWYYLPIKDLFQYFDIPQTKEEDHHLELELNLIRSKHGLDKEKDERLWKVLLKEKSKSFPISNFNSSEVPEKYRNKAIINRQEWLLYHDIQKYLMKLRLNIVSFSHFLNAWINPDHPSNITQDRLILRELCKYLSLPNNYFVLLMVMTNSKTRKHAQFTNKMNRFLAQMFELRCFEVKSNLQQLLSENFDTIYKSYPYKYLEISKEELISNFKMSIQDCIRYQQSNYQILKSIEKKLT